MVACPTHWRTRDGIHIGSTIVASECIEGIDVEIQVYGRNRKASRRSEYVSIRRADGIITVVCGRGPYKVVSRTFQAHIVTEHGIVSSDIVSVIPIAGQFARDIQAEVIAVNRRVIDSVQIDG